MGFSQPNYCPSCGTELVEKQTEGRTRRYCHQCEHPIYQNPKPCAGVLVVDERERVLLVERTEPPAQGAWSIPAGYLEADEPPLHAATRELHEETNLVLVEECLQLLDTVFVQHPSGQYVLVLVYTASHSNTTGTVVPGSDAADAQFWDLAALQQGDEQIEPGYESVFEQAINTISQS